MHRRTALLGAIALGVAAFAAPALAQKSDYPVKPIRWIVPFPPGGSTDTFSRPVAARLGEILGQPVVVENVPGAGASIGMDRVAKAAPDGYTIGLATTGTHAINPHLYGAKLPHDTSRDFTALTLAARYFNVLLVNPKLNINTVPELLAWAKANPDKVTFGSAGNGSSNHLSGEVLKLVTGLPMTHVPYRGAAPALADLIAGNTTFMFDVQVTAIPAANSGRVKALAITADKRSPFAPGLPTMGEAGVKGFAEAGSDLWFGIVGPAGIPKPIVQKLNQALIEALRSPQVRERAAGQGFELWTSTPEEFAAVIRTDRDKWGRIVKGSGAKVD